MTSCGPTWLLLPWDDETPTDVRCDRLALKVQIWLYCLNFPTWISSAAVTQTQGIQGFDFLLGISATYFLSSAVPKQTEPAGQGWRNKFMLWDKEVGKGDGSNSRDWLSGRRLPLVVCVIPIWLHYRLISRWATQPAERARESLQSCGSDTPANSDKTNIRIRTQFRSPDSPCFPLALFSLTRLFLLINPSLPLLVSVVFPLPSLCPTLSHSVQSFLTGLR